MDIGDSTHRVKDIYLSGNLSDGTNSKAIADIVKQKYLHKLSILLKTGSSVYGIQVDYVSDSSTSLTMVESDYQNLNADLITVLTDLGCVVTGVPSGSTSPSCIVVTSASYDNSFLYWRSGYGYYITTFTVGNDGAITGATSGSALAGPINITDHVFAL